MLHPSINYYYDHDNSLCQSVANGNSHYTLQYINLRSFIERFYLYTQLEKINQKIKKYEINIDDLF